jgi:RimJ/RimL family protein N-acetyltransferase
MTVRQPIPLPDPMPSDGVVELRAWTRADAPFLAAIVADDHLRRFIAGLPAPSTMAATEAWIDGQEEARANHERLDLAVVEVATGEPVGAVGLTAFDPLHRRAELGYWTAPAARRRGIARRATPLMARWAFEELGLERLQLLVEPVNMGSIRVAEQIGAVQEGLLRDHSLIAGQRRDVLVYGLLPDELR